MNNSNPAEKAGTSGSSLDAIISDFVDGYSYADMAHVELDESTRHLLHDAIVTLIEREDFLDAIQEPVVKKWRKDWGLMQGFAQLLKENGLMPGSRELISATRRFLEQNTTPPPGDA